MHPLKMYFLLHMGIFHGYISLPEGKPGRWCFLSNLFLISRDEHDEDWDEWRLSVRLWDLK